MEQLPEQLQNKRLYPEGGRVCYFSTIYNIARYMMTDNERWQKTADLIIHTKGHQVRWYFVSANATPFTTLLSVFTEAPETEVPALEEAIRSVDDAFTSMFAVDPWVLDTNELIALFELYNRTRERLTSVAGGLRYIDRGSILELQRLLGNDYSDELLRIVTMSERDTFVRREELETLRIAATYQKDTDLETDEAQAAIHRLTEEFAHGSLGYFEEVPTTKAMYQEKIQKAMAADPEKVLKKYKEEKATALRARHDVLDSLSEDARNVANVAAESTYLKDLFKYILNHGTMLAEPLWQAMAHVTGKEVAFLKDLSTVENTSLLNGEQIDEEYVRTRTQHAILLSNASDYQEYVGDDAEYIRSHFLSSDRGALKGRSACPGKATGAVRIIVNANNFHKMQDGDVLVAINTSPDFTTIMKRASAILTEEGGITSHASVVSREMNVPCIVGISGVTERLKDGDLVEVDADKGVVRKIDR
jgi:phosphohistidine swiveling domain-containing protein